MQIFSKEMHFPFIPQRQTNLAEANLSRCPGITCNKYIEIFQILSTKKRSKLRVKSVSFKSKNEIDVMQKVKEAEKVSGIKKCI